MPPATGAVVQQHNEHRDAEIEQEIVMKQPQSGAPLQLREQEANSGYY
jgi:hypothetical protein